MSGIPPALVDHKNDLLLFPAQLYPRKVSGWSFRWPLAHNRGAKSQSQVAMQNNELVWSGFWLNVVLYFSISLSKKGCLDRSSCIFDQKWTLEWRHWDSRDLCLRVPPSNAFAPSRTWLAWFIDHFHNARFHLLFIGKRPPDSTTLVDHKTLVVSGPPFSMSPITNI